MTPGSEALRLVDGPVRVSHRCSDLTFTTPALDGPTTVRVLLPAGYDDHPDAAYPVIHLYHGGGGDHTTWSRHDGGEVEWATAGRPVIVVMPDGGAHGFYTDFFHDGALGPPAWETFHVHQLVPWIDAHYRTIPQRGARAMAGFSMGGGGLRYAARHPDLVGAVAAFSGAVDITQPGLGIHGPVAAHLQGRIFGTFTEHEVRWRARNGVDLAENLRRTDVSLYVGDTGDTETVIAASTAAVHERLDQLGIDHRHFVLRSAGHDYGTALTAYRDWLDHVLPRLTAQPDPEAFTMVAVEESFGAYGWTVHVDRPAREFAALQVTDRRRFALVGSGCAVVTTPGVGEPGARWRIEVDGADGPGAPSVHDALADAEGRVTVTVDLGPGNPHDQFSAAADGAAVGAGPTVGPWPFPTRGEGSRFARVTVRLQPD